MKKIHVFTSAACNYIPKVRMLFRSLRELHPEFVLHLALADERTPLLDLASEPFDEVMALSEMEIPDWQGWAFCHSIVELATAIKPFYMRRLLEREDCDKVIYLDPDTVAFSRLDDIVQALDESNIVLTPHQIVPESTLSAVIDNEICSLKHGVYNLGFVAVSNRDEAKAFADWWADRIYHFCRSEIHNGLFTDQRWIDLVPAFFEGVGIVRSSRHNVAPWNLTTREVSRTDTGQYLVDGKPLGFYHFTGFDSGAHLIMTNKNAGGNDAVQSLVNWYLKETADLGRDPLSNVSWKYGTYSDGAAIPKEHRFIYRQRVDLQRAFPNPFDASGERSFSKWVATQGPLEYPALFDPERASVEMVRLSKDVSCGFCAGVQPDAQSWAAVVGASLANPRYGLAVAKRALHLLKTEGYGAVVRRIRAHF